MGIIPPGPGPPAIGPPGPGGAFGIGPAGPWSNVCKAADAIGAIRGSPWAIERSNCTTCTIFSDDPLGGVDARDPSAIANCDSESPEPPIPIIPPGEGGGGPPGGIPIPGGIPFMPVMPGIGDMKPGGVRGIYIVRLP